MEEMKMEEQKKAFRNGYDIDIMPSDINTFGKEAKSLLNDLQNRNERLFMVTILIMNTAETKRKLDITTWKTTWASYRLSEILSEGK